MRPKILILIRFGTSVLFFIGLLQCSKQSGRLDKIIIKGSTTMMPIAFKAAEVYMKQNNVSITISATGSGNGIRALTDGRCDIAVSSRALSKEELAIAELEDVNIEEIVIAYDMIVIIVHQSNKIENLTVNELRDIYSGNITNWNWLGSEQKRIAVLSRDNSSGTYTIWNRKVIAEDKIVQNAVRVPTNSSMVYTVSSTPGSIGYIGFGYLNNSVKALTLDSIKPTIKNGMSGKYPLSRKLYMIINKKKATKQIQSFIDFIFSEKGQGAVKEAGYIPL